MIPKNLAHLIASTGGYKGFGKAVYPDSSDPARAARMARLRGCVAMVRWAATIRHAESWGVEITRARLAGWSQQRAGKQYR